MPKITKLDHSYLLVIEDLKNKRETLAQELKDAECQLRILDLNIELLQEKLESINNEDAKDNINS